jgi:hypothetical protein
MGIDLDESVDLPCREFGIALNERRRFSGAEPMLRRKCGNGLVHDILLA